MDRRRIGVRAIIWYDGKLLAVKHKSKKDGKPKDFWAIPGGGLDPGESLEDGARREVREELGVEAAIGRLLFLQQFASSRTDRDEELEFFFLVENPQDFIDIDISKTSHGAAEIAFCEFIDPKSEYILPRILSEIDMNWYVETPRPVLVSNELQNTNLL
jgi:ADP-ribose pyrophosphatase YjhB (NUDIX family)